MRNEATVYLLVALLLLALAFIWELVTAYRPKCNCAQRHTAIPDVFASDLAEFTEAQEARKQETKDQQKLLKLQIQKLEQELAATKTPPAE